MQEATESSAGWSAGRNPRSGAGLPLPGLKHWRLRRGMSQADLALRAGLTADYLFKVESGRRGCNPEAAQELAAVLEVDLRELRTMRDDPGEEQASSAPARPRVAHRRVHQAYLRILLIREAGSAYAAMEEWEIERHCEGISWEGVIGVVRARKQELGALGELMRDERVNAGLPAEVRSFLEAALEGYPDLDIRLLAASRRREPSEGGREALTEAMRELL
jgi:transcriptional regulator with XRE-family HTH domain